MPSPPDQQWSCPVRPTVELSSQTNSRTVQSDQHWNCSVRPTLNCCMGTVSQTNSGTAAEAVWRICWGWSGMHKHFPRDSLIYTILNWTKICQEKNIKRMQSTPVEKEKKKQMEMCVWKCYSWWEKVQMDVSRKIQCTILSTTTPASDKLDN